MKKELICISFGASQFKLAHMKGLPNKEEISTLLVKDIGTLSDPDIAQLIRTSLNELKIKSRSVICR